MTNLNDATGGRCVCVERNIDKQVALLDGSLHPLSCLDLWLNPKMQPESEDGQHGNRGKFAPSI